MQRIAVLMTCYNRVETTLRCLQRLVAQKLPEGYALDIWLVDDASPDGTGEKVAEWGKCLNVGIGECLNEKVERLKSRKVEREGNCLNEGEGEKCLNVGIGECLNRNEGGSGHSNIQTFHNSNIISLHVIRSKGGLFWCKGMRLAWDAAVEGEKKCLNVGMKECLNEKVERLKSRKVEREGKCLNGEVGKCLNVGMKECLNHNEDGFDHSNIQTFSNSNISPIPDFFLWLNDDVMLVEDALLSLFADAEALGGNGKFVLVGTMASDSVTGELSYGCHHGGDVHPPNGKPQLVHGYSMSGNLVLVPRAVYEAVGPIYGKYSHAFGDSDYGFLIERNGIGMYCASKVLGVCPQAPARYLHLNGKNLIERIKLLFEPKGLNLHDTYLFRYRNWGFFRAILSCCHVLLRVIIFYRNY